jgi:ElaB/YqjD/DUF883 family membrane-anchored ribosome-binding protein
MEARIESTPMSDEAHGSTAEKLVSELKAIIQRVEEKTVERAKAADRVVREHPYPTIGVAFGVGLLIGVLAARRK